MEVVHNNQEEILMGSNEYLHVVKGKRTKRQRPLLSPLTLPAMTTSTSSSGGGGDEQRGDNNFRSPTISVEFSGISSEEEEDMANCLILLAQGGHKRSKQTDDYVDDENGKMAKINSRRFYNDAAATTSKASAGAGAGLYLYECKTCNKCYSSFQALGGHRASHKRPNKGICNEEKTSVITKTSSLLTLTELESPRHHQFNDNNNNNNNNIASSTTSARPSLVLQMENSSSTNVCNNNKSRVHECSICGSEFSSGQALGGHMRRHRTSNAAAVTTTTTSTNIDFSHHQDELNFSNKKARNGLSLDLNLPAQEEDYHHRESSKFSLFNSSKQQPQQPLVFSASALVDCHY